MLYITKLLFTEFGQIIKLCYYFMRMEDIQKVIEKISLKKEKEKVVSFILFIKRLAIND